MALAVRNRAGETVTLSDKPFARGGEAEVYDVPKYPNAVVKIFHPQVLSGRGELLQRKIDAMSSHPVFQPMKQDSQLSWPLFSVFDEAGRWRGYAMRRAKGVRMSLLAHAMAYRDHFPGIDRFRLTGYLITLLQAIDRLHRVGVMVGDYNPANFLCDPQSDQVYLIDCDSWQVKIDGTLYPCPVAAPDMLPPELHNLALGQVTRTLESERFSLAILLFKVIMLGRHPFDVVGGEDPVSNIRKGYFPYGLGGGGIPKGPWYNIWSHLSFRIKEQFIATFKEGTTNPALRTPVEKWIEVFRIYQSDMQKGFLSSEIRPEKPKDKQYRGKQSVSQPIATS
ncbi:MAG TPA: hypothetical protein PKI22_08940 [Hydrogenophilus thermoluteolus]|nr:hypothetical protein [Hydrogenophilus thermoluteolus]HNU19360.1 hypothetical protein [Hydrogenophilus thermoluteolus]